MSSSLPLARHRTAVARNPRHGRSGACAPSCGARWATRAGVHIDRAACAWLIRRHLDPEAEFVFVDDPDAVPPGATPFNLRGVELSHRSQGFRMARRCGALASS